MKCGEQWIECGRCGLQFPLSQTTVQKGLRVCTRSCRDDLTLDQRPRAISDALGIQNSEEGTDRRFNDVNMIDLEEWL
jgi:hypothetical protein